MFRKAYSMASGDDPIVRVSVHRLRKTLADFYAGNPSEPMVLTIPRGEYRLVMSPRSAESAGEAGRDAGLLGPKLKLAVIAVGLILAIAALAWVAASLVLPNADGRIVQNSAWQQLRDSPRPLAIVVSDTFPGTGGRADTPGGGAMENKGERMSYISLPIAQALEDLVPHLAVKNKRLLLIPASQATPSTLKENDILYIGGLRGLSFLEAPVFRLNRYRLGPLRDRIVDSRTKKEYAGEEEAAVEVPDRIYSDFGYVALQAGKEGQVVAAVIGTGNMGLRSAAEMASSSDLPAAWDRLARSNSNYEVLIEARGQSYTNISNHLVSVDRIADH